MRDGATTSSEFGKIPNRDSSRSLVFFDLYLLDPVSYGIKVVYQDIHNNILL